MTTPKLITHEHKLGTLTITFAEPECVISKDEIISIMLSMSVAFELATSGEVYRSTFTDAQIRALCPVFSAVPDLVIDALAGQPEITATDAMVTATFTAQILTRIYPISLAIARVRVSSASAEVAELQRENVALRTRVRALEAEAAKKERQDQARDRQLMVLANICLRYSIHASEYPGPFFEECLALSGRRKIDVLNEYVTGSSIGSIMCDLKSDVYERLIADGLDPNRGTDSSWVTCHPLPYWLYYGISAADHPKQLDRVELMLHHGLNPMTPIPHAWHTGFPSLFSFMLSQRKRAENESHPDAKREVGQRYDSLIKLMISKGAK